MTVAHQAISDAVHTVDQVLDEPAPSVLFVGFGDSALNFEIRAFVGALSDRLPTLHALHTAINRALDEVNITIPFPQRDLHLKSDALEQYLRGRPGDAPSNNGDAPTSNGDGKSIGHGQPQHV